MDGTLTRARTRTAGSKRGAMARGSSARRAEVGESVAAEPAARPRRRRDASRAEAVDPRTLTRDQFKAMPITRVWKLYKSSGAVELRNYLVEHYMPLVRSTAERIRAKLPAIVEVDDLASSGMMGLMCAVEAFDMAQGAKFETFCSKRVRGAIFDNIRLLDPASRLARRRESMVAQLRERFRKEHGREASEDEIRAMIEADDEEKERIVRDSRVPAQSSLTAERPGARGESTTVIEGVSEQREGSIMLLSQKRDLREWLVRGLTPAERLVVLLYYYEDLTMREIGLVLGRSESRVSQMHSLILQRLKARLRGMRHELEVPVL